jgi:hypothetical protein
MIKSDISIDKCIRKGEGKFYIEELKTIKALAI